MSIDGTGRPHVSLVIEFENARYVTDEEAQCAARELARQAVETPYDVEILVPSDAPISDGVFEPLRVRRFDVPTDRHYYEVKNAGAAAARGDVVVLADIDVVVLDGWLTALVKAFDDWQVEVAVGTTVVRPLHTIADKTFAAATWFPAGPTEMRNRFFANNMAVRTQRLIADGFPPIGCRYRGSCRELGQRWMRFGVGVAFVPDAVSHHPPPPNPVRRAIWDGHDQCVDLVGGSFAIGLARTSLHQLVIGSQRLLVHRSLVGLRWREVPVAFLYNLREALARVAGFGAARFTHRSFHRYFKA